MLSAITEFYKPPGCFFMRCFHGKVEKTKFCVKKDVMEAIFDTVYLIFDLVAAIIISFGCYLPVTLLSKSKPKVGLLMIPKTCAYMWVIAMGLQLMF